MTGIQFVTDEKGRKVAVQIDADKPRPAGCMKLKGHEDQWRVRVGDWRVVYIIDDAAKLVNVTRIAHRSEVDE